MKKITILLPVLLAAVLMSFTTPGENDLARQNFSRQFAGAEHVKWTTLDNDFQKASFVWGGSRTEAYFTTKGEFVGAIRGLLFQQLPLVVARMVDQKFQNRVILEVREVTNAEGTSYSILMDWKNKRYRARLQADGAVIENEVVRK
ncbi:MAG: hypothetical protein NVV59_07515 [Chitinophagaceae bacterium]|nr:hypothetical protein [Chitinophagaceae bacterium]